MRSTASADGTALARVHSAAPDELMAVSGVALSKDPSSSLIMEFDTLIPAADPVANSAGAVRGITGGGLPWVIEVGSGSLSRDGHLRVRIRGLVLASHAPVPVSMRGTNPFPAFRVVVSSLTIDPNGKSTIINVTTGDFQASPAGNSDIDARVSIPEPCIAPVVLVIGPSGAKVWLAAAGTNE